MKLRNKKSLLTRRSEGSARHSIGSKVTQKIYLLILFGILFYLGYIALSRTFYLEERGQIEVERTILSSVHGGKIAALFGSEGKVVRQGALLVRIERDKEQCLSLSDSRVNKLILAIKANSHKRDLLKAKLSARQQLMSEGVLRRALEAEYGRAGQSRKLAEEVDELKLEIKLLDIELEQQAAMLKELEKIPGNSTACHDEVITAPRDGVIQAVTRELHEVVKRGEPILSFIADDATVLAETYIDDDEIAALEKGKVVSIVLPDNTHTNGVIKSVKSSAAMHAERVLDHYVPIKSRLFVMMEPKTSVDADLWKQHDRMNIYVSIRK